MWPPDSYSYLAIDDYAKDGRPWTVKYAYSFHHDTLLHERLYLKRCKAHIRKLASNHFSVYLISKP